MVETHPVFCHRMDLVPKGIWRRTVKQIISMDIVEATGLDCDFHAAREVSEA